MIKLLIIEDDAILAENHKRVLKDSCDSRIVDSANEAISELDELLPDVIILDILLRGQSAFGLLNELQSYVDTMDIPVVICSNLSNIININRLKEYNIRSVLDKSNMKPSDLIMAVRQAVE